MAIPFGEALCWAVGKTANATQAERSIVTLIDIVPRTLNKGTLDYSRI